MTAPRFREDAEKDEKIMQVRFDGPLVMSRSICGTRGAFISQNEKIMEQEMIELQKTGQSSSINSRS